MKTATATEFLASAADALKWVEAGEVVEIQREGVAIARLVPKQAAVLPTNGQSQQVDWSKSAAFTRNRTGERVLTDEEVKSLLG
jgi:antitoxin (DNA-binding transcriptional repressor) of toxin-antitoxin stability system